MGPCGGARWMASSSRTKSEVAPGKSTMAVPLRKTRSFPSGVLVVTWWVFVRLPWMVISPLLPPPAVLSRTGGSPALRVDRGVGQDLHDGPHRGRIGHAQLGLRDVVHRVRRRRAHELVDAEAGVVDLDDPEEGDGRHGRHR